MVFLKDSLFFLYLTVISEGNLSYFMTNATLANFLTNHDQEHSGKLSLPFRGGDVTSRPSPELDPSPASAGGTNAARPGPI